MKDVKTTIEKLIDNQKVAFVGSIDAEGFPNIKAMLEPRKREGLQMFYFSTNTSSMRVDQFRTNAKACLYFYSKTFPYKGVMLKGTMEVLTDSRNKEMIWQEGDTIYYKEGVTDPDYCVLRFTATNGRYFSSSSPQSENFSIKGAYMLLVDRRSDDSENKETQD